MLMYATDIQTHTFMSVVNRVKRFFAQTISGYREVMKETNPDIEYTSAMKMNPPSVVSFQDTDCNDIKEHSFDFPDDWENVSQLNFDMNDFELELQKNSPVKTGYEQESEYTSETEGLPPTEPKEMKPPAKKRLRL